MGGIDPRTLVVKRELCKCCIFYICYYCYCYCYKGTGLDWIIRVCTEHGTDQRFATYYFCLSLFIHDHELYGALNRYLSKRQVSIPQGFFYEIIKHLQKGLIIHLLLLNIFILFPLSLAFTYVEL